MSYGKATPPLSQITNRIWLGSNKHALTYGMAVMRMVYEGKTNSEITKATGLPGTVIAAYKAWNTLYSDMIGKMLVARGKTEEARKRDLEFLASIGVTLEDSNG